MQHQAFPFSQAVYKSFCTDGNKVIIPLTLHHTYSRGYRSADKSQWQVLCQAVYKLKFMFTFVKNACTEWAGMCGAMREQPFCSEDTWMCKAQRKQRCVLDRWWEPEHCGQWLSVRVDISDEWCPSVVHIGTGTV